MATLAEMSRRWKGLNLFKIYQEVITEETEEILDLNRDQLEKGKTSKGKKIKPKYKKRYAEKKNKLNPMPGLGTPDLKLSGGFYKSRTLKNKSGIFIFGATVAYKKYIEPKYDDIYGLDPKNQKIFIEETATEVYIEKIREQLQI